MAQLRSRLQSPLMPTFNRVCHREAVAEPVEKNRLHPTRLKNALRSALVCVAAPLHIYVLQSQLNLCLRSAKYITQNTRLRGGSSTETETETERKQKAASMNGAFSRATNGQVCIERN